MTANVEYIFHEITDNNNNITEDSLKEFYNKNINNHNSNNYNQTIHVNDFDIKKSMMEFNKVANNNLDIIINNDLINEKDTNTNNHSIINNDLNVINSNNLNTEINDITFMKGLNNVLNKIDQSNDKEIIMLEIEKYYLQFINENHHNIIELLELPTELTAIELEALLKR